MSGETSSESEGELRSAPAAAASAGGSEPCCATRDLASQANCVLCARPICRNCQRWVNSKRVCAECLQGIVAEVATEQAQAVRVVPALLCGVAAALLCGIAWTLMVVITDAEIGFAAIGVGFATGYAVWLGAGRKKGRLLQWIAIGCAILGLILGKYFTVVHSLRTQVEGAEELSWFEPQLVPLFFRMLPELLSPFDALWTLIALQRAWSIPRPTVVRMRRQRGAA